MPTSFCRPSNERESPVLHTILIEAMFHPALQPLSSTINCAWVISQVCSLLQNTIWFTRQYCMLGIQPLLLLENPFVTQFDKICPVQTFSHVICKRVVWNMFTIICTCLVSVAKYVCVCVCMWETERQRETAYAEIKEDCCYLVESVFRHCKEGNWHQEPKQWTCTTHTGKGPSVQLRRQIWIFLIQLCSDNAPDMFTKEWRSNPMKHPYDTSALISVKYICCKYITQSHFSFCYCQFWL